MDREKPRPWGQKAPNLEEKGGVGGGGRVSCHGNHGDADVGWQLFDALSSSVCVVTCRDWAAKAKTSDAVHAALV